LAISVSTRCELPRSRFRAFGVVRVQIKIGEPVFHIRDTVFIWRDTGVADAKGAMRRAAGGQRFDP
jgi:hypothetical protein